MKNSWFALIMLTGTIILLGLEAAERQQEVKDLKRQLGTAPAPQKFIEPKPGQTIIVETNARGEWQMVQKIPVPKGLRGRVRVVVED